MPPEWNVSDDELAAGTICPTPDCGALAVAYRSSNGTSVERPRFFEFTCPRCGIQFTVAETELIFQSVPKSWLLAKIQVA